MNTYRVIFPATDFPDMDAEDIEADGAFIENSGAIRLWKEVDCNDGTVHICIDKTVAILPPGTAILIIKRNVNSIS